MNPGQYKKFNIGQFQNRSKPYKNRFLQNNNTQQNSNYTEMICNYCKKPGHLVQDCKIQPNNQSQTAHQEYFKAVSSTGALRKALIENHWHPLLAIIQQNSILCA